MKDLAETGPVGARPGKVALACTESGLGLAIERSLARRGRDLSRTPCDAASVVALRADPPDVLVIEARGTDGGALGLCQSVRQDPALRRTRLVVLQETDRPVDRRRAVAMGADACLAMPVSLQDLAREIDRLLDGR